MITTPITRPISSRIAGAIAGARQGGAASPLLFSAPLQSSLVPSKAKGSATPTFTRASAATLVDWEGLIRTAVSGEARFAGARRVENLFHYSEDFTNEAWVVEVGAVKVGVTSGVGPNGEDAMEVSLPGSASRIVQVNAHTHMSSFLVKPVDGLPTSVRIRNATADSPDIALDGSWQRIAYQSTGTSISNGLIANSTGDTTNLYVLHAQHENVSGQLNQAPSEYVSTNVLSAPYHGAGVDGVKTFATKSGNTVSSNVVTEATGAAIGASDYMADASGPFGYISEGSRTNLCLHSRDFTNAAWSKTNVTAAKDATGADGVANAASTLTSTSGNGTIFQTVTSASAQRTISCDVKRKTGTGTVEITVDGGSTYTDITSLINGSTYTRVTATQSAVTNPQVGFRIGTSGDEIEADYFGLESAAFASSRIATTSSAVTRAADVLTYDDADNIQDAAGTAYAEVSTEWSTAPGTAKAIGPGTGYALYSSSGADDRITVFDGTNSSVAISATENMRDGPLSLAATWGSALTAYIDGTVDSTPGSFDGSIGLGDIGIGCRGSDGSHSWFGTLRNVRTYNKELTEGEVAAI